MNAVKADLESGTKEGNSLKNTFSLEDFVPIGSFGGSQNFILRVRDGRPIAANTGDQGGGQN